MFYRLERDEGDSSISGDDKYPEILDGGENIGQRDLLGTNGETSSIRSIAAGTCARRDGKLDKEGYAMFGWIYFGARDNKDLCVATITRPQLAIAGKHCYSIEEREQAAAAFEARKAARSGTYAAKAAAKAAPYPDRVLAHRDNTKSGGKKSFWSSEVTYEHDAVSG